MNKALIIAFCRFLRLKRRDTVYIHYCMNGMMSKNVGVSFKCAVFEVSGPCIETSCVFFCIKSHQC